MCLFSEITHCEERFLCLLVRRVLFTYEPDLRFICCCKSCLPPGAEEGWKFSRMYSWLPLFLWVNSLNSLSVSSLEKWECWESCLGKVKIFWDFWNTRSCADCQILDCFITFYEKITSTESRSKGSSLWKCPLLEIDLSAEKMRGLTPNLPPS